MSAGETGGGAQVKSAVRTVELLEYFAGRPGMHSLQRGGDIEIDRPMGVARCYHDETEKGFVVQPAPGNDHPEIRE